MSSKPSIQATQRLALAPTRQGHFIMRTLVLLVFAISSGATLTDANTLRPPPSFEPAEVLHLPDSRTLELPDALAKTQDQAFTAFLSEQQKLEDAAAAQATPEPTEAVEVAEVAEPLKENDNFAQRAKETVLTFSDSTRREVVGKLIAINPDSLEIQRIADSQILILPVAMLCDKDKAFASYLWEQQTLKESDDAQLKQNPIEAATTDSQSQAPHTPAAKKDDEFARRTLKQVQVLSDATGRKLVAEILEVRADSLKIRRQSDYRIIQLPHSMLCAEDQAFAAYLWKQQILESSITHSKETKALAEAKTKAKKKKKKKAAEAEVVAEAEVAAEAEALYTQEAPASSAADMIWNNLFQ